MIAILTWNDAWLCYVGERPGAFWRELSTTMKLFFAVLFAILAAGFISFMTLSLNQAVHLHPAEFVKPATNTSPGTSK
jgi:hypothetical protein